MTFAGKDDRIEKLKCACGGMADTIDLGSIFERSAGSSPVRRTNKRSPPSRGGFFCCSIRISEPNIRKNAKRSKAFFSETTHLVRCFVQMFKSCWSAEWISEPNSRRKSCLSDSPDATLHFYPHSVEKSIDIPGKIGYNKTKEQTPADRRRKGNDHRRDLSWRLYFRHGEAG